MKKKKLLFSIISIGYIPFALIAGSSNLSVEAGTDCAMQSTDYVVHVGSDKNSHLLLKRTTNNGDLDRSFNGGAQSIVEKRFKTDASRPAVAVGANDMITVCGPLLGGLGGYVVRYLPDGGNDRTFGTGGLSLFNVGAVKSLGTSTDLLHDIVLDNVGNTYVVGTTTAGTNATCMFVAKLTATGALDRTFASDGIACVPNGGVHCVGTSVGLQDHQIIIGGYDSAGCVVCARYTIAGTVDVMFGNSGMTRFSVGESNSLVQALAVDARGAIVLVGSNGSDCFVSRLTSNGAIDTNFNSPNGYTVTAIGKNSWLCDVKIAQNSSIVVTGQSDGNVLVAKYTRSGILSPAFGETSGYTVTPTYRMVPTEHNSMSCVGNALALTAANTIIVSGVSAEESSAVRNVLCYRNSDPCPLIIDYVFCSGDQNPAILLGTQCCQRVWVEVVGNQVVVTPFSLVQTDQTFSYLTVEDFDALGSLCACS